jgi:16S rRNA (adenine1518-N6/adenine1519-N6)-dimethyltransferase
VPSTIPLNRLQNSLREIVIHLGLVTAAIRPRLKRFLLAQTASDATKVLGTSQPAILTSMTSFIAKKSLGQHFLHAPNVVGAMIHAAQIKPGMNVLEIGPGKGILTRGLLGAGAKVIAVEKDGRAIEYMKENFAVEIASEKLKLIQDDILAINPADLGLEKGNYVVAANIPYYITGEILRKFLTAQDHPSHMVLLVQKEVAKRIVAADNKESILSISVKAYGEPKYIDTVPKRSFRPIPKVDSAIILIDNISKQFFENDQVDEKLFFDIVRTGFAHKRKVLRGNLVKIIPAQTLQKLWIDKNWPIDARAETFTLNQWKEISKETSLFHTRQAK